MLLNLAPDHLDWHGSEAAYVDAKRAVMRAQGDGDVHVGNRDDAASAAVSAAAPCPVVWFRLGEPGVGEVGYVDGDLVSRMEGTESLGPVDADRAGYRADAAAAAAASLAFGVSPDAVRRGSRASRPSSIAATSSRWSTASGSWTTRRRRTCTPRSPRSTRSPARPGAVLIAGGRAKGVDLSPLAHAVRPAGGGRRDRRDRRRDRVGLRRADPGAARGLDRGRDGGGVRAGASAGHGAAGARVRELGHVP